MSPADFTATLLRSSASGFAGLAATRIAERSGEAGGIVEGDFDAWQGHFRRLVLELAAAAEDGGEAAFAAAIGWTRAAFAARGLPTGVLSAGLEELEAVLEESLPPAAWRPLPPFFEAARTELARDGGVPGGGPGLADATVEAYLSRLQEGDAPGAIATVTEAVERGDLAVAEALAGTLTRALHEIGRRWHTDAIHVAQEHFATQVTGRVLERLVALAPASRPNGHTVLLAMIEGDAHELGLRIVAALFELDGWRTICLGANMPSADLSKAVADFDVDLLLLGATLNTQRTAVARAIRGLREARPDLKILAGGPAFEGCEERAAEIGADGCALSPGRAVELGRMLLGT